MTHTDEMSAEAALLDMRVNEGILAVTAVTSEVSEEDLLQWIENTRSLRSLMRSDPHRPIYHFVAPEGHAYPFDPNGAIYWKGKYHLGYIYQKQIDEKPQNVWGHIVSTDLLHWTQYPDMLDVKEGDRESGIFSGGAFLSREGVPHIIYYGLGAAANLLAYATDDELKVWKKVSKPALTALDPSDPNELNGMRCCIAPEGQYSVFDPEAWYDKRTDAYYQISGGMKPALFKSKDMRDWTYLGDVIDRSNSMRHPEEDLSRPNFFSLGDKSMLLLISHPLGTQYYIGTFANDKFSPERHGRMNWPGGSFFAPDQLQDGKGRNIIWGWVIERKPPHLPDYGWSGIMSLPRVVSLGEDGRLRINPPEELKTIRVQETRDEDIELTPSSERTLRAQGKSIELKLEISGMEKTPVGVKVLASQDDREETVICYDPIKKELVVDFSKSSMKGPVTYPATIGAAIAEYPKTVSQQRAPLELKKGEPLKLDIFLDRSVIEVFANGVQCVTQVVYPELEISTGTKVFSGEERVIVKNIQSWTIAETNAC